MPSEVGLIRPETILNEVGLDMSRGKTEAHFAIGTQ
jgi:hypothetical protein